MTTRNRVLLLIVVAGLLIGAGVFYVIRSDEAEVTLAPTEVAPAVPMTTLDAAPEPVVTEEDLASVPEGFALAPYLTDAPVRTFTEAAEVLDESLDYHAIIETTAGTMQVDLFEAQTPRTVNNFVFLALHRYYDDLAFHRVIDGFVAQGGDPSESGAGGPGYRFEDEIVAELVHDVPGILSMANAGPDTNGSQFFITMAATPWLDGAHAVFGRVTEGLEVLDTLERVDPQTPQVIAAFSDPASVLVEQGVQEAEGFDGSVEAWISAELGKIPGQGEAFTVGERRGVLGTSNGATALGLFGTPDRMVKVTIITQPKQEDPS